MADTQRDIVITRVALLELEDERRLAKEGYDLLDEKRILLAAAIRRELERLKSLLAAGRAAEDESVAALEAAVIRHGLDELCVHPPHSLANDRVLIERSQLLGLTLLGARWQAGAPGNEATPVCSSPEARRCAAAYRQWIAPLAALAACSVNIRRLAREFARTERRARAIENILLPEITALARVIEERLEQLEQEEIARLRQRRGSPERAGSEEAAETSCRHVKPDERDHGAEHDAQQTLAAGEYGRSPHAGNAAGEAAEDE
jgi:V/A-type H+-transporting ATPase subunit D